MKLGKKMKFKDIVTRSVNEATDPDAEKIIRSYEKRIEILETVRRRADQETKNHAYLEPKILEIVGNVEQLARANNVDIRDQIDTVNEAMQQLASAIYGLREAFDDAIYEANSAIEKLQYED
jgi:hypothetical protein